MTLHTALVLVILTDPNYRLLSTGMKGLQDLVLLQPGPEAFRHHCGKSLVNMVSVKEILTFFYLFSSLNLLIKEHRVESVVRNVSGFFF